VYECTEHFFPRFTDKRRPHPLWFLLDSVIFIVTAVICPATAIECKNSQMGVLRCKAGGALGRRLSGKQEKNFLFTISDNTLHREVSDFISPYKLTFKEKFFMAQRPLEGQGNMTSHLVGLLWTSDQPVAENST